MARKANDAAHKDKTTATDSTVNASENTSLVVAETKSVETNVDILNGTGEPSLVPVSFNAGLSATILNSSIDAIIEKSGSKTKLFVNSKPEETRPATMADLAEMLKTYGLSFNPASLDSVLNIFGINSSDLSIELSRLFFYTELGAQTNEDTSKTEFAFKITINNKPNPSKMSLFAINSLSFAVWKTARSNVLKSLNLMSVDELLNSIE